MRRIFTLLAVAAVFCFFVPLTMADKGGNKPDNDNGHGGGGGTRVTTQKCDMSGIVEGSGQVVGIDVGTYGPEITLSLDLSGEGLSLSGDFNGQARVLKATTSSRLDFFFTSDQEGVCDASVGLAPGSPCDYRLTLTGGMYSRSTGEISFSPEEHSGIYLDHKINDDGSTAEYETLLGTPGNKKQGGGPQDLAGTETISNFADVSD